MSDARRGSAGAADDSGTPGSDLRRETILPYGRHQITAEDIDAVVDVLGSNWLTTGPVVRKFEDAMADRTAAAEAVAFSSGTAALHAAAYAADLGEGDEVITSPMTFCATANSVLYQGATPVFADVSADTLNLDPTEVERRITDRTRALIPVDYAGHPADLGAMLRLAEEHDLVVIEDACHAPGAKYRGRPVGSISHMSVFSFHAVKHIATGEGGMVVTDDPELAARLRHFRSHGIDYAAHGEADEPWMYEMTELGYNYRLSDIHSALGLAQLQRLDPNLAVRRRIARRYERSFAGLAGVTLPTVRSDVTPAWHLYPIRLELERLTATRRQIFDALRDENIGVQVHFIPVHLHPYYRSRFGYGGGEYPVAEDAYQRLITLPLSHGMSDADADDVVRAVVQVLSAHAR